MSEVFKLLYQVVEEPQEAISCLKDVSFTMCIDGRTCGSTRGQSQLTYSHMDALHDEDEAG